VNWEGCGDERVENWWRGANSQSVNKHYSPFPVKLIDL
jgi:hypothetical protein